MEAVANRQMAEGLLLTFSTGTETCIIAPFFQNIRQDVRVTADICPAPLVMRGDSADLATSVNVLFLPHLTKCVPPEAACEVEG